MQAKHIGEASFGVRVVIRDVRAISVILAEVLFDRDYLPIEKSV